MGGDLLQGLGSGQPIVFSHGWPLSADDWDTQMMFFLQPRLSRHRPRSSRSRPIHPDRRRPRHGPLRRRPGGGDRAPRPPGCDPVGHSTGGGEVARYLARHGESRVAKAVLISSVPPLMVKTDANPGRPPQGGLRRAPGAGRDQPAQFYRDLPSGPFYGFNRPGVQPIEGDHPELVAPGHDGGRQGALRRHRRLLAD